ncbi:hypothetical protein ACFLZK_02615 [Patescibacteria group bacterium]
MSRKRFTRKLIIERINFFNGERVGFAIKKAIELGIKTAVAESAMVHLKFDSFSRGPEDTYTIEISPSSTLENVLLRTVNSMLGGDHDIFILSLFSLRKYKEKD